MQLFLNILYILINMSLFIDIFVVNWFENALNFPPVFPPLMCRFGSRVKFARFIFLLYTFLFQDMRNKTRYHINPISYNFIKCDLECQRKSTLDEASCIRKVHMFPTLNRLNFPQKKTTFGSDFSHQKTFK